LGFFSQKGPQMVKAKKRINFGREEKNLPELNLALVQKESWEWFLKEGIAEELAEINPIDDFTGKNWQIILEKPELGESKLTPRKASEKGLKVTITDNLEEGCRGANVVYTDVWASMGQEEEHAKRLKAFKGYEVTDQVMKFADKDALFMHCLPAHRGEEVSASVIDGPKSIIFDQAENRLHAQKAVLYKLMKK